MAALGIRKRPKRGIRWSNEDHVVNLIQGGSRTTDSEVMDKGGRWWGGDPNRENGRLCRRRGGGKGWTQPGSHEGGKPEKLATAKTVPAGKGPEGRLGGKRSPIPS